MKDEDLKTVMIRKAAGILAVAGLSLVRTSCDKCGEPFYLYEDDSPMTTCPRCTIEIAALLKEQAQAKLHSQLLHNATIAEVQVQMIGTTAKIVGLRLEFPEAHLMADAGATIRCDQQVRTSVDEIKSYGYGFPYDR